MVNRSKSSKNKHRKQYLSLSLAGCLDMCDEIIPLSLSRVVFDNYDEISHLNTFVRPRSQLGVRVFVFYLRLQELCG